VLGPDDSYFGFIAAIDEGDDWREARSLRPKATYEQMRQAVSVDADLGVYCRTLKKWV
jgi:hypothetical protein